VSMLGLLGLYLLAAGILFESGAVLNLLYPPAALLLGPVLVEENAAEHTHRPFVLPPHVIGSSCKRHKES